MRLIGFPKKKENWKFGLKFLLFSHTVYWANDLSSDFKVAKRGTKDFVCHYGTWIELWDQLVHVKGWGKCTALQNGRDCWCFSGYSVVANNNQWSLMKRSWVINQDPSWEPEPAVFVAFIYSVIDQTFIEQLLCSRLMGIHLWSR